MVDLIFHFQSSLNIKKPVELSERIDSKHTA